MELPEMYLSAKFWYTDFLVGQQAWKHQFAKFH